jgi:NitT/TauT family transport system ATP-binding protein
VNHAAEGTTGLELEARTRGLHLAELNSRPFGILEAVSKSFPAASRSAPRIVALESVSYTIRQGELISLLGPSGCGKTTLLRIIAGLTGASSGRVEIRGRDVIGPQEDFGFVFQSPNLLPWRTVLGNVLFPMEIAHRNDQRARNRAMELLDLVGLAGFAKNRPHQLSGGMKQRVVLCRALVPSPSLLLMDEPFGALDELTRMEMQDLLLNIRRVSGTTIVFVTHSIAEAIYLADEVLVFSRRPGRVIDYIRTDFPYPRRPELRYSPAFTQLEHRAGAGLGIVHGVQESRHG